jgi:hypothetical protein
VNVWITAEVGEYVIPLKRALESTEVADDDDV